MIKRIIIIGFMCLFLISIVSCGGGTLTEPVVSEKTTSTDEVSGEEIEVTVPDSEQGALIITSAFEAIKAFYSAANKRDYSEAQKYLFSDFLSLFEEPPISQVGGIEKILDLFTANGAVKEIILDHEEFVGSSEKGAYVMDVGGSWSPEIVQAIQQRNVELWEVYYTIEFEGPLGEQQHVEACVVKEADTYKISTGWEKIGLPFSIMGAATSAPWDFKVYDISSHPGREGYTEYEFLIGMKYDMKELASKYDTKELAPYMYYWEGSGCIKAIWDQYEYEGSSFYLPWNSTVLDDMYDIKLECWSGRGTTPVEYWPPKYTYLIKSFISVPSNITDPTFYLITPDLRYFKIDLDGPWPKIPASPSLEWFDLGQTLEVEDYWSITPLALKKFNDGEKFILSIRLENLSGYDQWPEEGLYLLQIRPVITEFSSELSKLDVIPAFCGREFGIGIPPEEVIESMERGLYHKWEISPIEGAIADLLVVVKDQETKKPISYKIYRLE